MVQWNKKNSEEIKQKLEGVDFTDKNKKEETEEVESMPAAYDDMVKIVARDLVKACTDLAAGYDKKLSETLQNVADKVAEITE